MQRLQSYIYAHAFSPPAHSTTSVYVLSQISIPKVITLTSLYSWLVNLSQSKIRTVITELRLRHPTGRSTATWRAREKFTTAMV